VPAAEIERIVLDQVRMLLQTPEVIVQTWRAVRQQRHDIAESEVRSALVEFIELWDELFPAEQARIVELLVHRQVVFPSPIDQQASRLFPMSDRRLQIGARAVRENDGLVAED
jgi:site-specific DNA recombinase